MPLMLSCRISLMLSVNNSAQKNLQFVCISVFLKKIYLLALNDKLGLGSGCQS